MRKRIVSLIFVSTLAAWLAAAGQSAAPERSVHGNIIVSDHDPAVRIELPSSARYVGGDRWILYGMADCELHAFVEADSQQNVQRLYWVQFEGYLPSRPELHHTYDSPRHAEIGGLDFYVDTWVRPKSATIDAGSDREHIDALLRAKDYRMPAGMMYVRFVHLLDSAKRKELMIIYGEDLSATGRSAEELSEGGRAHDQWGAIETKLVQAAKQRIVLHESVPPENRPGK